jgi:hypothetical protein
VTKFSIAAAVSALALVAAASAQASVLYDDGPIDGTLSAWTINFGFAVSDSFTLSQTSTVTGVNFGSWNNGGDHIKSVDWAITATPGAYPVSGTAAVSDTAAGSSSFGYDLAWNSFSTGGVTLGAGTYYLVLQNAVTKESGPVYWDINNGPSTAFESYYGPVKDVLFSGSNANSFQIVGETAGGVPEPAAWSLMILGTGFAGAGLRSRRRKAALA